MQSIRIAVLALALCFGASLLPVQSHAAAPLPKVKIETSMGDIVVELNPAKAPKTVSNFLYYVKSGFYNNTIFHRVINGFMIQGGGHTADMQEKANSRKPVVNEAGNGLKNDAYTIAMARTNDPDSATGEFTYDGVVYRKSEALQTVESRNSRLQMGLVGLMFLAFVLATYFRSAMPLAAGILLIVAGQALRLSRLPKDILSHLTDTGRREL